MVDLDYIAQNRTDYEASARARGLDLADLKLDEIFKLVEARRALIAATDALRQERNALTEQIAKLPQTQRPALIGKVKTLKDQLKPQQEKLTALEAELKTLSLALPNIVHPDMPRGKDSRDNKVIKEWGIKPKFDFTRSSVGLNTWYSIMPKILLMSKVGSGTSWPFSERSIL